MPSLRQSVKSDPSLQGQTVESDQPQNQHIRHEIRAAQTGSLKANSRNARTHSRRQLDQIAASIRQFGFINPILVDQDGVVVAGHGRMEAAKLLGLKTVPTILVDHLSDAEKRAFMLADNRIAESAGWDKSILAIELEELSVEFAELEIDLGLTGFETGEIDQILLDHENETSAKAEDIIPESLDRPVSRRGDVWQLGHHRLLCGDARSELAMTSLLDGEEVGLTAVDFPFNVKINGHVGGRGRTKHKEFAFASGEMSDEEFGRFLRDSLVPIIGVSKAGALIYCFMDWRHIEVLLTVGRELDLSLANICIWNKSTPGQGSFYRSAHEMIAVFAKPGAASANNIQLGKHGRNRSNVWTYPGVNTFQTKEGDDLTLHPTVKPVAMIAEAIKDASHRHEIVLDSFLGSGTTLLAAEKVGRRCYGMEYEPKYIDTAIRRWQAMTGRDAILASWIDPNEGIAGNRFPTSDLAGGGTKGLSFDELISASTSTDGGHNGR